MVVFRKSLDDVSRDASSLVDVRGLAARVFLSPLRIPTSAEASAITFPNDERRHDHVFRQSQSFGALVSHSLPEVEVPSKLWAAFAQHRSKTYVIDKSVACRMA